MINKEFSSISAIIDAFPDEQSCIEHLEKLRWNNNAVSPFDSFSKIYSCSGNRYRCQNTGKYFNVKTGTVFHNSRISLQKWFIAIWIVANQQNISSVALGRILDITQKTAWYMLHRIKLYIGESEKSVSKHKKISKAKTPIATSISDQGSMPLVEWLQSLKK